MKRVILIILFVLITVYLLIGVLLYGGRNVVYAEYMTGSRGESSYEAVFEPVSTAYPGLDWVYTYKLESYYYPFVKKFHPIAWLNTKYYSRYLYSKPEAKLFVITKDQYLEFKKRMKPGVAGHYEVENTFNNKYTGP